MTQIGQGDPVSADERQRRVALQRCVKACRVVVPLELGQLPFQIAGMPEQHVVEEFSPHRPDQALHQRVGQRDMRDGFELAVLAMHQRLMKRQKRGWTDGDRELSNPT
jgi:hypothetical protein